MDISFELAIIANGLTRAVGFLCILSYLFEVETTIKQKCFYVISITALSILMLIFFDDNHVILRTIIIISYIFLLSYLSSKNIMKTIIVFVAFIIGMATAEMLSITSILLFWEYSNTICSASNSAAMIVLSIVAVIIKKLCKRKKLRENQKAEITILVALTLIAVFIAASLQINFEMAALHWIDLNNMVIQMYMLVMVVMYIVAGIAAMGFNKGIREERKNKIIREQQQILEKMYDSTRIFRHNYKNILISLKGYCDDKNYEVLTKRIDELTKEVNNIYSDKQWLDVLNIADSGLRNLIMLKSMEADKKRINLKLKILGKDFPEFENMEMMNVIGVLMDNAIEASSVSKTCEMELDMIHTDESESLTVINSFRDKPDMNRIFDKDYTTKSNGGLGLYYVDKIVERKSNVNISFDCRDEFFVVMIVSDNEI